MSLPSREPWLGSMKHQATSFTLSGLVELTLVSHGPSTEPIQQPPAGRSLPMLVTTCRCSMFSLHAMSNHPASPAGRPKGLFYIQQFPLLLPKAKHRALLSVLLSALKATSAACESGCLVLSFLSPSTSLLTKKVGVFVIFYKSPFG